MQQENTGHDNETELAQVNAAKSDPALFAPLYDKYYKPIFIFVYARLKNKELTADVVAQVFLKAMLNIGKFQYRGFPFSSWLYRIAFNEMNLLYRKTKKETDVEITEQQAAGLIEGIDEKYTDENIEILLEVLSSLPDDQQKLIELRFFQKMSFREVGDMFEITEDNAKIKVYRAIEKLKKTYLEKWNNNK